LSAEKRTDMKNMWDQRYAESKFIYGTEPNLFFKEQITSIKPGRLLLPGEGEGRNATFAVQNGWEVDAFDYSAQAVENAQRFFEQQKLNVNNYQASILDHASVLEQYDVIALLYLHLPSEKRKIAHEFLIDSVKSGGVILMEMFSKNQIGRDSGGPKNQDMLYDIEEIKKDFEGFEILKLEEIETDLSEGILHKGKAIVIRFVGRKRTSGYLELLNTNF